MKPRASIDLSRHELDSQRISRTLYRLLSLVMASKAIAHLSQHDDLQLLDPLARMHEETELIHLLITSAVEIRITQERSLEEADHKANPTSAVSVGKLWESTIQSRPTSLTLREACNKIIHAESISPNWTGKTPYGRRVFARKLCLHGEKNGQEWKAILDVCKFVAEAVLEAKITWTY